MMPKDEFIKRYEDGWDNVHTPTTLVIAVKLPDGKVELIINSAGNIENKFQYYLKAYDHDMCLKTNVSISIKDIMLV